MTVINYYYDTGIKPILKGEKFPIKDSLTEELIRSLTTKIFYTLSGKGVFSQFDGTIDIGHVRITPYRSIRNDTRFIIFFPEIVGLADVSLIWNGKFLKKKQNGFNIMVAGIQNFDLTERLEDFVVLEKKIIEVLNNIKDGMFDVIGAPQNEKD